MTSLHAALQARLEQGPIPAAEAMALALYHPEQGYYRRKEGPWGFEGKDYYTALDIGPLLGETLAVRLEAAWLRLDCPASFQVLEPGAGRGWLGRDLLAAASGAFAEALTYVHRDDNPAARSSAEEALGPWLASGRATLQNESDPLPPFRGAILSNELFDALPTQPWRWEGAAWYREMLTTDGPAWVPGDPGEAGDWFLSQAEGGLRKGDGSTWNLAMASIVKEWGQALVAGSLITIDYGNHAAQLLSKGAGLRRYHQHQTDGAWWKDLGLCDLTSDVDFTRLAHLLMAEGFEETDHQSLSHWIRTYAPLQAWESSWQSLPATDRVARMENLLQLTLPAMMGERFRVLEAWKPGPS